MSIKKFVMQEKQPESILLSCFLIRSLQARKSNMKINKRQIRSNVKHIFALNGLGCFLPNAAYSMLIMETVPNQQGEEDSAAALIKRPSSEAAICNGKKLSALVPKKHFRANENCSFFIRTRTSRENSLSAPASSLYSLFNWA